MNATARPGKPSFADEIYAGGVAWGTKFTTELPPPRNNRHSYDDLYFVADGDDVPVQLPVSEAAPGESGYTSGRWFSRTATVADRSAYGNLAPLTSAADVAAARAAGAITAFRPGAPEPNGGDPVRPTYFQCPLVPAKD